MAIVGDVSFLLRVLRSLPCSSKTSLPNQHLQLRLRRLVLKLSPALRFYRSRDILSGAIATLTAAETADAYAAK
ncbi:MAG: hypothetical protein KME13_11480 [Myxacorys californica WJT36-NPBG1]|nr:hypothetical protein [Myxacorys californica WJT36-NPBG1]